jgi:hypothetical protein
MSSNLRNNCSHETRSPHVTPFPLHCSELPRLSPALRSVLHASAALVTSTDRVAVQCGPTCKVSRHAWPVALAIPLAQCSLLFSFPTSLHQRADLAALTNCASNLDGHPYEFRNPAEACTTICDASHPLELVADPWE